MRIVIVNKGAGLAIGGMGVYAEVLKKYLLGKGHEVFELRFSKKKTSGKNVVTIPYHFAEKQSVVLIPKLRSAAKIEDALAKIKPDIVYVNFATSVLDFLLPRICRKLGIALAGTPHGEFYSSFLPRRVVYKIPFKVYLPVAKKLALAHVYTQRLRNYLVRKGVERGRIVVIPNGVDVNTYRPGKSNFAKKHGIEIGVLFLGRVTSIKNPELLIKSFLKADLLPKVKLVIVGGGDLLEILRDEYSSERIIFTGQIEDVAKKIDVIRSCQIYVLPSKYEGMPLTVLEAMACGLVPIVSDVGGNAELVKGVGKLIPVQELGGKLPGELMRLVGDPGLRARLGEMARKRAVEKFSQKETFARLESELLRVAGEVASNRRKTIY